MRVVLILWLLPIIFFWGWYGLSAYDINMGSIFLSRAFHDHIFRIYGQILGMNPADVPAKLAWVFIIDTLIILAVAAFRWRASWLPQVLAYIRDFQSPDSQQTEFATDSGSIIEYADGEILTSDEPTRRSSDQSLPAG